MLPNSKAAAHLGGDFRVIFLRPGLATYYAAKYGIEILARPAIYPV